MTIAGRNRRAPEIETRAAFPSVTADYLAGRRAGVLSDGAVPLSETVAAIAQTWSKAFSMLDSNEAGAQDDMPLRADVLAAIGLDLCLRGESCWHVRVEGGDLQLVRVAWWVHVAPDHFQLHIAHPNTTETIRALTGKVVLLTINSPANAPRQGRSPFQLMGGSTRLMAEIESAVSGAMDFVGRGILPMPDLVPEEQQAAALAGLKAGGRLAVVRSRADFSTNTGNSRASEWKRIDLGPDLESADLNPMVDQLHARLLTAAGIPPALFAASGNAGAAREAYRLFVLQTIEPLARQLLPELAKIGITVGTLVGAGMSLDKALALVGWQE